VAGRYQPLADDVTIAGDIRPNPSSAVDSEDKAKQAFWGKRRLASPSAKRVAAVAATDPALAAGNRRALPAISG